MSVGLTREELERLLDAAQADGPRSGALITLLAYNGLRVDEALSRDVEHLGHQLGHRAAHQPQGRPRRTGTLSPPVERTLDSYLDARTTGPLFLNDSGRRMYEAQAWRLVRRLARKAGLKAAGQLSPHPLSLLVLAFSAARRWLAQYSRGVGDNEDRPRRAWQRPPRRRNGIVCGLPFRISPIATRRSDPPTEHERKPTSEATGGARTASGTRSRPASTTPASPSKTFRTPWATPTHGPPGATWPPTNTWTATRRTPSLPGCAANPTTSRPRTEAGCSKRSTRRRLLLPSRRSTPRHRCCVP